MMYEGIIDEILMYSVRSDDGRWIIPVTVNDIKEGGIYYIYKKTYNTNPHDEQNVTISIVRQAEAGEGKDFTYPTTSSEATGLYQYIDNRIKNFDLSWQILD